MTFSVVFANAFLRALAALMLPVMIVSTVRVLSQESVLKFLVPGSLVAMLLAGVLTLYNVRSQLALLHITSDSFLATQSVWDALAGQRALEWKPILDLRRDKSRTFVTAGEEIIRLDAEDWPQYERIVETLRHVRSYSSR